MSNIAIILAAGTSSRCTTNVAKQYQKINGKPIIAFSIEKFKAMQEIDDIIIVVNKKDAHIYTEILNKYSITHIIYGGKTRQESVFNALTYLQELSPKHVLIHDAARPFVSNRIISEAINLLNQYNAVIPVIAIEDTIKKIANDKTILTVNREDLYRVQTPQAFNYQLLYSLHKNKVKKNFTDDASILEEQGSEIKTFKGSQLNFKITTLDDLTRARKMYNNYIIRTGIGFDIHSFDNKNKNTYIKLAGIEIPSKHGIIAHSDGDVFVHSLVDALLGSIAKGDIGDHFPDDDLRYKNKDSEFFLQKTKSLLAKENAEIINIDSNIICEKPKISSYKDQMRKNLANILQIDINKISIKATTAEKLGFIGRQEGIAVQTIVNVKLLADE